MSRQTVGAPATGSELAARFASVRRTSERLCAPLAVEDYVVQSMPDVSPTKWHLAHVSWFFETFVLKPKMAGYRAFHDDFEFLFNSYYNTVGAQFARPRRGLLTRPTVEAVFAYRAHVDERMLRFLEGGGADEEETARIVELGLHHEQQHQELLLMDIKHVLSCNPLWPAYREPEAGTERRSAREQGWLSRPAELREIGHDGITFGFDNEGPRHRVWVPAFRLASRLVTNADYLEFVEQGGYSEPALWLADGWTRVQQEAWEAPLYWVRGSEGWCEFTLHGLRPVDPDAPVSHVSYFEADAFASWAGARLPSEAEWETLAAELPVRGNLLEDGAFVPLPVDAAAPDPAQMFGDVWEWTRSAYAPYPGFRAAAGALGEYNGKFMCNQQVLRGGACVTPRSHVRASYRNFFYPHCRWQFGGIRLAADD